jgi:hypothetical protein
MTPSKMRTRNAAPSPWQAGKRYTTRFDGSAMMRKIIEKIQAKARAIQRAWYAATHAEELMNDCDVYKLASLMEAAEKRTVRRENERLARENARLKARLEDCEPVTARMLRRVS